MNSFVHKVLGHNFIPQISILSDEFQGIIERIINTGPTLTAGLMHETHAFHGHHGAKTSWWGLDDWEQFPYLAWGNIIHSQSHFHEEQDWRFNFEDLEDVFSYPNPLVMKTTLDIVPANEKTQEKYEIWKKETINKVTLNCKSTNDTKEFVEEMVTDEISLDNGHNPNTLIPSIQIPSLVTNQTNNQFYHHLMEAREN